MCLLSATSSRRWITDEWTACSRLCGSGIRERLVVCVEENQGIKSRVISILFSIPKYAKKLLKHPKLCIYYLSNHLHKIDKKN